MNEHEIDALKALAKPRLLALAELTEIKLEPDAAKRQALLRDLGIRLVGRGMLGTLATAIGITRDKPITSAQAVKLMDVCFYLAEEDEK